MNKFKRVMFRFVSILAFTLAFIPLTNLSLRAQEEKTPLKLKVAIYENPPKIYTDTDGTVKGFWPDIIEYMAKQQEWDIEYINGTFNEGLERVKNNEVDMMVDVGYSGARSKIFEFSDETAFINWAGVYSSPNLEINSFADFTGKRIAILDGDIHAEGPLGIKVLMNSFGFEANYLPEPSYADALKAVSEGKADIAVVNRIFGTFEEHNYNVKRTSVVFDPIELKFIFPIGGAQTQYLHAAVDKQIKLLKDDPDSIYYKSIISNLEGVIRTVEVTPSWIRPLIIGSISITLLAALLYLLSRAYQATLERRVKEKTQELLRSEVKFKDLTDLLPQTIFETNIDGVITYVNNAGVKEFGYSMDEFLSKFKLEKLFAPTLFDSEKNQVIPDLMASSKKFMEFTAMRKDHSFFQALLSYSIIKNETRNIGVRGIIANITEQKETQEALSEKVSELEAAMRLMVENEEKMSSLKSDLEKEKHKKS